jgi:hypothetical protein
MKRQAYTAIAMIALSGFMAITAKAQSSARTTVVANIPFEFNVHEKVMPAGDYTLTQINPSSDRVVLQLRSKDGESSAMVQMGNQIGAAKDHARLVFRRYGNRYFFAEVWADGEANGLRASKCRTERAAATQIGVAQLKNETIALRVR